MAALANQPSNYNYLSTLHFSFVVKRLPSTTFFIQSANLPGIGMNAVEVDTPFKPLPRVGDKMNYSPFIVDFKVDEDMRNYIELHNWITKESAPRSFGQYKSLGKEGKPDEGPYSDGTLIIHTSAKNPNILINFEDMFPVQLGDLRFDMSQQDVDYITCQVSFQFSNISIKSINSSEFDLDDKIQSNVQNQY